MAAAAALRLLSIEASPPELRGIVNLETGEPPRWIDLALTVVNSSKEAEYHAVASIRRMGYDAATATLSLELDEREVETAGAHALIWHFVVPKFVLIPPGETTVIQMSVPEVINWITVPAATETGVAVESVDISDLQHVQCTLAYADRPFDPDPKAPPEAMLRELSSWGQTIEATLQVTREGPPKRRRPEAS